MRNFKYFFKGSLFIIIFLVLVKILIVFTDKTYFIDYNKLLWNDFYNDNPYDVFFVGASQFYDGINPGILNNTLNKKTFNLCSPSQKITDSYYALKEVYAYCTPELVVLDASKERLKKVADPFSAYMYAYMKPSRIKYEYFNTFPADFRIKLLFPGLHRVGISVFKQYFKPEPPENRYKGSGFFPTVTKFDSKSRTREKLYILWDQDDVNLKALDLYEKTIELCKTNGSKIILITMPYREDGFKMMTNYQDYYNFISKFAQLNNVEYLDFNYIKSEYFTLLFDYFYDDVHLNMEGADLFSNAVAELLSEYFNDNFYKEKYFYSSYEETMKNKPELINE